MEKEVIDAPPAEIPAWCVQTFTEIRAAFKRIEDHRKADRRYNQLLLTVTLANLAALAAILSGVHI